MNAWWIFRVDCGSGKALKNIYTSKQMQLSDAQAAEQFQSVMQAHAGKTGCTACALRLHQKKWMQYDCRPVPAYVQQTAPPAQPRRHFVSRAAPHSAVFSPPSRHVTSDSSPHAVFAMPTRRPSRMSWGMRGMGGCAPCGMGAESDAYTEAEKVIAANPPGDPPWFIKHWPWVLVGGGALAAGMLYVGSRD